MVFESGRVENNRRDEQSQKFEANMQLSGPQTALIMQLSARLRHHLIPVRYLASIRLQLGSEKITIYCYGFKTSSTTAIYSNSSYIILIIILLFINYNNVIK